ncbi:MAG: chromate resistance protein ChrB domain-containing protein [Gemmatimonadaceae bacterium]
MRWITREKPKIDRVACPWLIARFIDTDPEFLFVPPSDVRRLAEQKQAIPFDVEGVELSHDGPLCSFDAFLRRYELNDPALDELAVIVRGADTARPDIAPQAAGLLAVSLGLSHNFPDDHEMLRQGFVMYDALYAWSRFVRSEKHTWNPQSVATRSPTL